MQYDKKCNFVARNSDPQIPGQLLFRAFENIPKLMFMTGPNCEPFFDKAIYDYAVNYHNYKKNLCGVSLTKFGIG